MAQDGKPVVPGNTAMDMEAFLRKIRLESFRRLNPITVKGAILFAGSSLAEQFPVHELLNRFEPKYVVYNRGVGGYTTSDLLETMDECIFDLEPSMIFLNIGSNDLGRPEYREDDLVAVYRRILLYIQERLPRTKLRVLSFYPVHSGLLPEEVRAMMFAKRTNESIDAVNLRLEGLASELGCTYIDVNTCLRDQEGNLDPKYTVEGIHLYPNAYEVVLDTLVKYF